MLNFDVLLHNYPTQDHKELLQWIGGGLSTGWNFEHIDNTCAIRMSRALNYSGLLVPHGYPGLLVVHGKDRKYYATRAREMKKWLALRLGRPLELHAPVDRAAFQGKKGIIGFSVQFKDAAGHIDLWDGTTFQYERGALSEGLDYFKLATKVVLWEIQ